MSFGPVELDRVLDQQIAIGCESSEASAEWLEAREIELEVLGTLTSSAQRSFLSKLIQGDDPSLVVVDLVGQAFRLGWECALASRNEVIA